MEDIEKIMTDQKTTSIVEMMIIKKIKVDLKEMIKEETEIKGSKEEGLIMILTEDKA